MRIVVVGSGGREHALAWKLSQEAEVFATPGNPGIAQVAECFEAGNLAEECIRREADLVVVGPENPLIDGLADRLRATGLAVFGPGAEGALLEGSKAFSKALMKEASVPTAAFQTFTDPLQASDYVRRSYAEGRPLAVKASGAALGKGVVVCSTEQEALEAVEMMMVDGELGEAGHEVVLEERLVGREFSLLAICNGRDFVSLPIAQDYKRALDGDRGPNTGGMGSYSPVGWLGADLIEQAEREVVAPMLAALERKGIDFRGVLFAGLMVQDGKPYCLEFNVRFGDPEIQTILRRLGSGFADLLQRAALGQTLAEIEAKADAAVTVVMASAGYPGTYEKGLAISLPSEKPEGVEVFHAGTKLKEGTLATNGGRVLNVTATGATLEEARRSAYAACETITWPGSWSRRDIASG